MSGVQVKYNTTYKQIYNNKDDIKNQTTRLEQKIKRAVLGINAKLSILIT